MGRRDEEDELLDDDMDPAAMRRQMDESERQRDEGAAEKEELPAFDTFEIDVTDGRGKRYVGTFTFHVPNLGAQVKIARLKAQLLPMGSPADANGAMIAEMMAYCEVTLDPKARPSWWKPNRFIDATPLAAVYGRCRSYEAKFLGTDKPSDGRDDAEAAGDGTAADGEDAVEREVPAPPERRETLVSHGARSAGAGSRARRTR